MDSLKYVAENSSLVCGILPRVQEAVYFLITPFVLILHASHVLFLNDFLDYYFCYIKWSSLCTVPLLGLQQVGKWCTNNILYFLKCFFPFPLYITFQYKTGDALVVPITYVLQYITVMEVVQPPSHFLFCLSLLLSLVSFLIFSWGQVTVSILSNTISIKVTRPLTPSNKQAPSLGSKSCFSFREGMQWISSPCVWSKVIKNCTTVLKI